MRHFEVEIRFAGFPFEYRCTTVFEALEAIRAVYDARHADPLSYDALDELAAALLKLKGTGDSYYPDDEVAVSDVAGEI